MWSTVLNLLIVSVAVLLGTVAFDGLTTLRAFGKGWVESNKLLVWVYRTNTPSAALLLGSSLGLAAVESIAAYELTLHVHSLSAIIWPLLLLVQSAGHVTAGIGNLKAK